MNQLDTILSDAIAQYGFRISPRLELEERLSRFIQMYQAANGRYLTKAEADACSGIMLLTHDSDSVQRSRRRSVSNQQSSQNFLESLSKINPSQYKKHSMVLRSSA